MAHLTQPRPGVLSYHGKLYTIDPASVHMGFDVSQVCAMNADEDGLYTMFYVGDGDLIEAWHDPLDPEETEETRLPRRRRPCKRQKTGPH